jgi:hypothetical protein
VEEEVEKNRGKEKGGKTSTRKRIKWRLEDEEHHSE